MFTSLFITSARRREANDGASKIYDCLSYFASDWTSMHSLVFRSLASRLLWLRFSIPMQFAPPSESTRSPLDFWQCNTLSCTSSLTSRNVGPKQEYIGLKQESPDIEKGGWEALEWFMPRRLYTRPEHTAEIIRVQNVISSIRAHMLEYEERTESTWYLVVQELLQSASDFLPFLIL